MVINMGKRIKSNKSKNSESFYIIEDFTDPNSKKRSTYVFEKLGTLKSLKEKYNTDSRDEILSHLRAHLEELRELDRQDRQTVTLEFNPKHLIPKGEERLFNIGYLYISNILRSLGIKSICDEISSRHRFSYDLCRILCDLVAARVVAPGSKRSTLNRLKSFIEAPEHGLENIYRSLGILADERYSIEKELYSSVSRSYGRDNSVLYYDCTNFYFETEDADEFRKYGKSKENRPNPIVQYGLFLDADGLPIADIVFPGNENEQPSMRELEERIEKDFMFSRFIVCADAGLNGFENKVYNDKKKDGAFIVAQPIRKLKKSLAEWCVERSGWKLPGTSETYCLDELGETMMIDGREVDTSTLVFYKDRWEKSTKKSSVLGKGYTLEEHIIITYSTRFMRYQKYIRERKLERAARLLSNPGRIGTKNQRDPRYYIKEYSATADGELADSKTYAIDEDRISEEEKYDGFYAVTTNLEDDDLELVIRANRQRWEIEESFMIMKSELLARPMYVSTEENIKGHLLTCFVALLVYRLLEKKHLKEKYTIRELIGTLRDLNINHIVGDNYAPAFKRTEITDALASEFGFQPSRQILTQKYLKKFIRTVNSKKSTKLKS